MCAVRRSDGMAISREVFRPHLWFCLQRNVPAGFPGSSNEHLFKSGIEIFNSRYSSVCGFTLISFYCLFNCFDDCIAIDFLDMNTAHVGGKTKKPIIPRMPKP